MLYLVAINETKPMLNETKTNFLKVLKIWGLCWLVKKNQLQIKIVQFWKEAYKFDELEHFEDGRVQEIVSAVVRDEGVDDRREEVSLDDVAVVELVLQSNDLAHEAESICNKIESWIEKG